MKDFKYFTTRKVIADETVDVIINTTHQSNLAILSILATIILGNIYCLLKFLMTCPISCAAKNASSGVVGICRNRMQGRPDSALKLWIAY